MSIIDLVVVSSLSVLLVFVSALLVVGRLRERKQMGIIGQLFMDKSAMSDELERLNYIINNSSDLNDGFIKFLSESREEAFSYISEVQQAVEYIKMATELQDKTMIDDAYNKLISFLPSDSPDVVE